MYSGDRDEFAAILSDLCTLYGRKCSDDLVRVYFDSLDRLSLPVLQRRVEVYRRVRKTFPRPADLMDARLDAAPVSGYHAVSDETPIAYSAWARYANRYMLHVCLSAGSLGDKLPAVLAAKRGIVGMAEADAADGDPWEDADFMSILQSAVDSAAAAS